MTLTERRAIISLSLITALRMIGLFMIVPLFALYAKDLPYSTPVLIGLAMGIYGLTQGLLQIPFGILSDHFGRRPVILMGLILFALGSLLAALSTTIYGVILGRVLQGGGAISSTMMAMMADLTQDVNRTKAMAIMGITIGFSFIFAMMLGPVLVQWILFQHLFWVAFGFSLVGIVLLFTVTPKPAPLTHVDKPKSEVRYFFELLKNPLLLRLNCGIFFLHAILTATFVALPIALKTYLGWLGTEQWELYVPILILTSILSLALIGIAERHSQVTGYFLSAIACLAVAQFCLWAFPENLPFTLLALFLFFGAFSLLEAFLPSLVSRAAPPARKGTALGLYSSSQFLGIFFGGLFAGWLYQTYNLLSIYLFCLTLALLWLIIAYKMILPQNLTTHKPIPIIPNI